MWRKPQCLGDSPGRAHEKCNVAVLQSRRAAPKADKERLPRESSCRLINGLTGILQLRKLLGCLSPFMKHRIVRSEEHTSELQSLTNLVCRLLLEKKKKK